MAGIEVPPVPEWDYEWDYSMGLLSSNGWTKYVSGSATETLVSNGVQLKSPNSGYVTLRNPDRFNLSKGVIECVLRCNNFNTSYNVQNFRVCFSNGTNGIQVYAPKRVLRIMDAAAVASGTSLGVNLSTNTDYTIKIVLDNGYGQVWLNGSMLRDNIDASTMYYAGNTSIWSQNQRNNYTIVKSVKLKLGRV